MEPGWRECSSLVVDLVGLLLVLRDWSDDLSVGRLVGCLIGRLVGRLFGRLFARSVDLSVA